VTLAPLLAAPLIIQIHAFAAIGAFVLGLIQFAAPKGTIPHRTFGWIWVTLMMTIAATAMFIQAAPIPRLWGLFSPIHLLAVLTLVGVPVAVWRARQHNVKRHRNAMIATFIGAMVIAGGASFLPGRVMHAVVVGR
jgi:uncharacterized membrane protein